MPGEIPGAPGSSTEGRDSVDDSDAVDDGGSGRGSDDRVLTPDSPDEPTSTTGSGSDRGSGSSSNDDSRGTPGADDDDRSSSGGGSSGNDDRVLTPDSPDEPTNTAGSGGDRGSSAGSNWPNDGSQRVERNPTTGPGGSVQRQTQPGVVNNSDVSTNNAVVQHRMDQYRRAINEQYDDLDRGDYQFVIDEQAQVSVRLTDSGQDKLRDTAEMNLINERVREDVDGDVRSVNIQEATEGGYVAKVKTADGDTVTRRFVFTPEAAEEFERRLSDGSSKTGSQADSTLSSRRESRVSGGGIATDGDLQESDYLREGRLAQDEILERIGATENDSQLPESIAQDYREQLAKQAGVDADRVVITGIENGKVSAKVLSDDEMRKQRERFGDIDWSFGLGDPETDEVEQALDDASQGYSEVVEGFANDLFDDQGVESNALGDDILRAIGQEELAVTYDREVRNFGRGVVTGAAALGNVPQLVKTGLEGVEYLDEAKMSVYSGDGGEFADQTGAAAGAAANQFVSTATANPANVSGQAVGALAGSVGAMSAASRISPRAGAAARWTIQPGEELAGAAGYRLTKRGVDAAGYDGTKAADTLFPNQEPILFSEEAAINVGKKASSKLSRQIRRTRYDAVDRFAQNEAGKLRDFIRASGDDRAQLDFSGRSRGTEVEVDPNANRQLDFDEEFAAEQDLSQAQYELRDYAEREVEVQRGQLRDVEAETAPTTEPQGPTVDADVLDERRRLRRVNREAESSSVRPEEMGESWDVTRMAEDDLRETLARQTGNDVNTEAAEWRRRAERRSFEQTDTVGRRRNQRRYETTSVMDRARDDLLEMQRQAERSRVDAAGTERVRYDTPDYRVDTPPTELEGVGEMDLTSELDLERFQELDQEMSTDLAVEPAFEVERGYERELERLRELETERESERYGEPGVRNENAEFAWDENLWGSTWRTGIADIDDLWRREFGR